MELEQSNKVNSYRLLLCSSLLSSKRCAPVHLVANEPILVVLCLGVFRELAPLGVAKLPCSNAA